MPLLWSIALILLVMQDAVSFESNVDEILKQILLVCGMCFFYRFASETLAQDNESTGRATVLFGRLYSYIAAVFLKEILLQTKINFTVGIIDCLQILSTI